MNPILATDSYKLSHWKMYPPNMTYMTSYLEARSGGEYDKTLFFGLQYILLKHFVGQVVDKEAIAEAKEFSKEHFGRDDVFNEAGWRHILEDHNGYLPLKIRAVPEGTVVPESNVLMTIENTCPQCAWLVNHCETLLVQIWYPCTVATISMNQKNTLQWWMKRTADSLDKLPFMLHDFGYRGSTSDESAAIGGAAHLVNFVGTDTMAALSLIKKYYSISAGGGEMAGFSIPAAEHSTICAWGRQGEVDAFRYILQQFGSGLVAVVSDTYNIYNAIDNIWGGQLYNYVWSGKNTGRTLVIRPDSGDPMNVVPECLDKLGQAFGYNKNSKGYMVLPDYLRVIQGDGINRNSLEKLCAVIARRGWSLENMAFGSGGGLLQDCNRDTLRFAMKASAMRVDNLLWRPISKSPIHDKGKVSKEGYLYLTPSFETTTIDPGNDMLYPVFENGRLVCRTSFKGVRETAYATN